MNQPFQPAASSNASQSGGPPPVNAGSDPYFSIAINVPSGPIGSAGDRAPASQLRQPDLPTSPDGHESVQQGIEILNELDIQTRQLEYSGIPARERPMPIRNSYCIDEIADFVSPDQPITTPSPANHQHVVKQQNESGRFLAKQNSVIVIDGNDGFDYIDLSDRDIAHVTFGDSSIVIVDAQTGESFTIEFKNIDHALFANGQMIKLQ